MFSQMQFPPDPGVRQAPAERVDRYLKQLNLLRLIHHLSLLLLEAQKHRGASMAVLEGKSEFETRVEHQQAVIQRLLALLAQLDVQSGGLIPLERWQGIEKDWEALSLNWRNDTVIANFEFHSHCIDGLVKLIWELATAADHFASPSAKNETNRYELVQIAFQLMPEMLENIAKLRGLATHASARGYCDGDEQARLVHLLQALNMNKERLRLVSRSLQHEALRAVPSLPAILLHEHKLVQLQQLIEGKIMSGGSIGIKSLEVFDFATEIIDIYSQIMHDGVTAFERFIEREMLA